MRPNAVCVKFAPALCASRRGSRAGESRVLSRPKKTYRCVKIAQVREHLR